MRGMRKRECPMPHMGWSKRDWAGKVWSAIFARYGPIPFGSASELFDVSSVLGRMTWYRFATGRGDGGRSDGWYHGGLASMTRCSLCKGGVTNTAPMEGSYHASSHGSTGPNDKAHRGGARQSPPGDAGIGSCL